MYRIAFVSDLHGHTPLIDDCEVAVFPGDFLSLNSVEEEEKVWQEKYYSYFDEIRSRGILTVGMPGNHDFIKPKLIRRSFDVFRTSGTADIYGFKFFFYCYNNIKGHNYYRSYGEHVRALDINIDIECDFFVTHIPPYDILSTRPEFGLKPIRDCVEKIRPKHAHIFGHCHDDRGIKKINGITYCNVSYCLNPENEPRYEYTVYNTDTREFSIRKTKEI